MPEPAASSRARRISGGVLVGLGVVLVVAGAVSISWASDAEDVTDLVRPELTDEGLAAHRADFETARNVFTGVTEQVVPALAADLGTTAERLTIELRATYPALDAALAQEADLTALAERSITNLERQQRRFERADSLPAGSLPMTIGPVIAIVVGALVVGGGVVSMWSRRRGAATAALGTCLVLGALLAVVPVIGQAPGKASDAKAVMDSLDPSQAVVDRTLSALTTVRAAIDELTGEVLPQVAGRLGVTPLALVARLAVEFPDVAQGLLTMPAVLDRYDTRAQIRVAGAPLLRTLADVPLVLLVWAGVFLGLIAALVAGLGLRWRPSVTSGPRSAGPADT